MSPRKRRIAKLARRRLTWHDVFISEILAFWVGWRPPESDFDRSQSHWRTWEEFLGDWAAVREEGLARWEVNHAERLAGLRHMVAMRAAALAHAEPVWRDLHEGLVAEAEAHLEELEREEAPFAERAYQRALAGLPPDPRDDDEDDEPPEDDAEAWKS